MGFLKRLLSVGGKRKRKNGDKDVSKKGAVPSGSSRTLPLPQEQEAVVNRLLHSSSTHFSVLSETEYRSMPPIPHPINNVLRAPSIISNATHTDTYTVTVHRRMLHSRTEFPNANRSGSSSPVSPTRRHSLPPLTPGDKSRLERLRQDASVLSLLDIYDDKGNPNLEAFTNTPARRERADSTLRALMGSPGAPSMSTSKVSVEESDISWADRYIRTARRDSCSSILTTSSLGIPVDLFKGSLTPDHLRFDNSSSSSRDAGIDSMQVERGTVEDSSLILHPAVMTLTSPTRRASQFFKFLSERGCDRPVSDFPRAAESDANETHVAAPPSPSPSPSKFDLPDLRASRHPVLPSSTLDAAGGLAVRDGPKQNHALVSPAPRHRTFPPPLPPVPAQYRPQMTKPLGVKQPGLGHRPPFDELHNAGDSAPGMRNISGASTARSVSVASSVYPQIETQALVLVSDPYTPVPLRGERVRHATEQNVPPDAPARPVRGQGRKQVARRTRSKENNAAQVPSSVKTAPNENVPPNCNMLSKAPPLGRATPPTTPTKNLALAHLQTIPRPSPASSSELSPQGRHIMASIRAKARKPSHRKTPRAWQPWVGQGDISDP